MHEKIPYLSLRTRVKILAVYFISKTILGKLTVVTTEIVLQLSKYYGFLR